MGNWNISIQGVGPYDTEEFKQAIYGLIQHVSRLQNRVDSASLTFGGQHDFLRNSITRESVESVVTETSPCCAYDHDKDGNCHIHIDPASGPDQTGEPR